MKFPFFVDSGPHFGHVSTDVDWQRIVAEQADLMRQSSQDAEQSLLDSLRIYHYANGSPYFTDGHRGTTLREWVEQEAAN